MNPDQFTNQELFLEVGDGHQLYIQDWGNKNATVPIVFLHGGPGGCVKDHHKTPFDPTLERVIFFDQRGCGKSLPYGSLEHNTTQDMLDDIEKIAEHLKLDGFIVAGGSWGSCLALAYALKHPRRVKAMVLRGIFTGSQSEIDWLNNGYYQKIFPDVWAEYLRQTPKAHHGDPSKYHFARILGANEQAAKESAYAYDNFEAALLCLDDRFMPEKFENYDPAGTKIEAHYLVNRCFMPDRFIMDNAHKLTMPIWLIQGRYDMVCPPVTAYELNQKLPNSQLIWTVAGHNGSDRSNHDVNRTVLLQMVTAK